MKLLLVEDNLKLGRLQKELLELSDFEVVWATDGKTALADFKTAAADAFDVVILDWMLPEISGLEICKILRSDKYGYQGGIIFVTAKDALDDCLCGLEAGADDYIVKPFENKELIARIKAVNRRKAKPYVDDIYKKSGFAINNNLLTLSYGERVLHLTKREYNMLKILFINCGQTILRSSLIEKVWPDNLDISESSLDAYIYLLRKKLAAFNRNIHIKSVKNVGYYLEISNDD